MYIYAYMWVLVIHRVALFPSYHPSSVSVHKLDNTCGILVPQVDVSTVTSTDHKFTARSVEVHSLHCNMTKEEVSVRLGEIGSHVWMMVVKWISLWHWFFFYQWRCYDVPCISCGSRLHRCGWSQTGRCPRRCSWQGALGTHTKKRIILIHFVDLPCELKYVCNTLTVLDIYLCHRDCTPGRLCWFWTHWTPGVRDKTFSKHRCCRSRLFSSGRRS